MKRLSVEASKIEFQSQINYSSGKIQRINMELSDDAEISDGYHTIEELYDHRITLYFALCRQLYEWNEVGYLETLDRAPEFDGHTDKEVLSRLKKI